jgi:hypothetical protein
MSTLAKVKAVANKLGARVLHDKTFEDQCLSIEAPKGKIWKCGEIHELCTSHPLHEKELMSELYSDAIDRMNYGVEDCPDQECEWCNSNETLNRKPG